MRRVAGSGLPKGQVWARDRGDETEVREHGSQSQGVGGMNFQVSHWDTASRSGSGMGGLDPRGTKEPKVRTLQSGSCTQTSAEPIPEGHGQTPMLALDFPCSSPGV